MSEYNPRRMILKFFKCPNCQKDFKNLVLVQDKFSKCPFCFYEQCSEIIKYETKTEKENLNNNKNIDTSKDNPTQNNNSNNMAEGNKDETIRVLVYEGSIRNGEIPPNASEDIFNLFSENPIDNFFYNFLGLSDSVVIINRIPFQNEENKPVEKNIINKLNHFKMEKNLCRKNEQGNLEFPKCTICLIEINEGMDCISLPCDHIFHQACITKWFEMNNTCPLCRMELSNKLFENKNGVNQNIENSNQNINSLNNVLNNTVFEDMD